jgi:hypothetical protein
VRPRSWSAAARAARARQGGNTPSAAPLFSPPHPTSPFPAAQTQSANLLFGADSPALKEKRVVTCQTLSGTGALTVAAHFIK